MQSISFIHLMVSEKIFLNIFFSKFYPFYRPGKPIKFGAFWTKVTLNIEDFSINISVKQHLKYPHLGRKNVNFHFSHYKSMENISCLSNQSSYQTGIKTKFI